MTFSVGGLATGLDTKSMISQLLSIDSRPKVRAEWSKSLWGARQTIWNDLSSKLGSLQTKANLLSASSTWTTSGSITSSDSSKVSGSSTASKAAAGSYSVEVSQLATTETWTAANSLSGATAGTRSTGQWLTAGSVPMSASDLLTATRDQTNTTASVTSGSTITMSWNAGTSSRSATFEVSATSTLGDLAAWAQTQIPGSTVAVNNGQIEITSAAGTASEVTSLSFSAKSSSGSTLARFNGMYGASSSVDTSAGDGGAPDNETLIISQGATTRYVTVAAGDSQAEIVNKIQSAAGSLVNASLVSGKLHVVSLSSGSAGGFTMSGSGSLLSTLGLAQASAGTDAAFTVNGTSYTRSSNTGITDVIQNVNLTLSGTTTSAATLTVGSPGATVDDIKTKVHDFVDQYNSIIDMINTKSAEKRDTNPSNLAEYLQGPMAGNVQFARVANDLRQQVSSTVSGQPTGFTALSSIGITTGAIGSGDRSGRLVIDDAKLEEAINTNRTAVKNLFSNLGTGSGITADDGIARKISETISNLRTGGSVDVSIKGAGSQIKSLQDTITRYTLQLDNQKARYERMFTALEKNVGAMQSQGSWLSGQISRLG